MTIKQKYEQYAILKGLIAEKESELEDLKAELIADMAENENKPLDLECGEFTIRTTRSWQHTPELVALEKQIKETKAEEIAKGKAVLKSETAALYFKATT